jgi:hypothetical protein
MLNSSRNNLLFILPLLLLVLLTGCQQGGGINGIMDSLSPGAKKYDTAYLKQTLISGKTTKAQVEQLFGAPYDERLESSSRNNRTIWTYNKNEEGLDKYMKLAHKYVSTETSLKMYDTEAQVDKGQRMLDDANSVAGTRKSINSKSGTVLTIYFKDDVVDYYSIF